MSALATVLAPSRAPGRWTANLVVLAGFAVTGVVLATLTPSAAIGVTFLLAGFLALVVPAVTGDGRAGLLLASALVMFAGLVVLYGPALLKVVPL